MLPDGLLGDTEDAYAAHDDDDEWRDLEKAPKCTAIDSPATRTTPPSVRDDMGLHTMGLDLLIYLTTYLPHVKDTAALRATCKSLAVQLPSDLVRALYEDVDSIATRGDINVFEHVLKHRPSWMDPVAKSAERCDCTTYANVRLLPVDYNCKVYACMSLALDHGQFAFVVWMYYRVPHAVHVLEHNELSMLRSALTSGDGACAAWLSGPLDEVRSSPMETALCDAILDDAISGGNVQLVEWVMVRTGVPFVSRNIGHASKCGHLELLKVIMKAIGPDVMQVAEEALKAGQMHILDVIDDICAPYRLTIHGTRGLMYEIGARSRNEKGFWWIVDRMRFLCADAKFGAWIRTVIMSLAGFQTQGRLDENYGLVNARVVTLLNKYDRKSLWYDEWLFTVMNMALQYGNIGIVEYIWKQGDISSQSVSVLNMVIRFFNGYHHRDYRDMYDLSVAWLRREGLLTKELLVQVMLDGTAIAFTCVAECIDARADEIRKLLENIPSGKLYTHAWRDAREWFITHFPGEPRLCDLSGHFFDVARAHGRPGVLQDGEEPMGFDGWGSHDEEDGDVDVPDVVPESD